MILRDDFVIIVRLTKAESALRLNIGDIVRVVNAYPDLENEITIYRCEKDEKRMIDKYINIFCVRKASPIEYEKGIEKYRNYIHKEI